jgi:hypothetical protein
LERRLGADIRLEQHLEAFERGEAPHIQQHDRVLQCRHLLRRIGDRSRRSAWTPATRAFNERLPPHSGTIHGEAVKAGGIEPVGQRQEPLRRQTQEVACLWGQCG